MEDQKFKGILSHRPEVQAWNYRRLVSKGQPHRTGLRIGSPTSSQLNSLVSREKIHLLGQGGRPTRSMLGVLVFSPKIYECFACLSLEVRNGSLT